MSFYGQLLIKNLFNNFYFCSVDHVINDNLYLLNEGKLIFYSSSIQFLFYQKFYILQFIIIHL